MKIRKIKSTRILAMWSVDINAYFLYIRIYYILPHKQDHVRHDLNPNALESKAGGSLCVPGQPGLHTEFEFQDTVTWLDPVFQSQVNKQSMIVSYIC